MHKCNGMAAVLMGIGLLLNAMQARAFITALTPLQNVLKQSTFIVSTNVESVDADKPEMVLVVDEHLKGKSPLRRLAILLRGDTEAKKRNHVPQILKRVAPRLPLLLFILQQDKKLTALAYTNGTWFRMIGDESAGAIHWSFAHGEPYLRKTFKGSTAELKQVVLDGLSGKKAPPKPDAKEKPGFGPEIPAESEPENRRSVASEALFAVIPTVFIGGPLAFLALLFPVVFGGLMLVLRRWLAALSVLSVNSTLYVLQEICRRWLANSWWGTPEALGLSMTVVTLLGILWAWRRQGLSIASGNEKQAKPPSGVELITLGILSALCLILATLTVTRSSGPLDLWGETLLMFSAGLWAATLHGLYRRWSARTGVPPVPPVPLRPGLPSEGVLLWTMLLASSVLAPTFRISTLADRADESVATTEKWQYRVAWRFQPKVERCWIASSPRVDGGRVYIGVALPSAFGSSGAVYCLDCKNGKEIWMFNDGGGMNDVFSSPCLAGERVYIGEGFHQHADCKLYCLDAATGKKQWDFATTSHIESTPCVWGNKVYFGAGDDGLYCLDADTGKKIWHKPGLHVDASPLVIDNRLYSGSGVGDFYKDTVLFCLNADTGEQMWRMPVDLPVWGMPAVQGEYLYAGIGNGNFLMSADQLDKPEKPAGAMLCLERATGKRVWRYDVADGVYVRPCVDEKYVWFAARDRHCYCVDRRNGDLIWKTDLGSAVVASPALAGCGESKSLYVGSSGGWVSHLDAQTGKLVWIFDVTKDAGQSAALFSSPLVQLRKDSRGESRHILLGCGLSEFTRGIVYCLEERAAEPSSN
jgi:outer membrane protein assembly factor BamB